ncbi:MAG: methylisocitrate lyase [Hydrogenibacillus schlegelii]|nr:methylisocitrate lyase [Hydrogenibacillus schlegelii]
MAWFTERGTPQPELAAAFRRLVEAKEILILPGVPDALAARLARAAGARALYLSGAAYTASRALPDLGLVTSTEVAERARDIVRAADLPLLVDIDTGFGGALNAVRTAREMVEARVAAIQIEDQVLPKKCGHLNGKALVDPEEMAQKVRAIKEVEPTLYVVARTDAYAVEGLERALERARLYVEAGADAIFPEALPDEAAFRAFRKGIDAPLLANMTEFGKTPYYTAAQFEAWGYQMVLFPVTALRMAAKAYEKTYRTLLAEGTQTALLPEMQTRKELYETIDYDAYEALDAKIAKTVLEESGRAPF